MKRHLKNIGEGALAWFCLGASVALIYYSFMFGWNLIADLFN